jgi:hypothetical protein
MQGRTVVPLYRLGLLECVPDDLPAHYGLLLGGDWAGSLAAWQQPG